MSSTDAFRADILAVSRIKSVPSILEVVCRVTGMGFAAVARVTEGRWIACSVRDTIAFGLEPGGELKVETATGDEIRQSGEPLVIDHVAKDDDFRGHPTPARYGFQSYISMPIILTDGTVFGTLCALDPKPASVNRPEIVTMLRLFAEMIASNLETHSELAAAEASLLDERHTGDLRDQFIAVLGHDLRNPLAAIDAGARLLGTARLDERGTFILDQLRRSVGRMAELINNVLDLARSQQGIGLIVDLTDGDLIQPVLEQVIAEFRSAVPGCLIETRFAIDRTFAADRARMGQLLSNLVGNALQHGAPGTPVVVEASTADGAFVLSVSNSGEAIPPALMPHLFKPFFRASGSTKKEGLGLGLFIASEIARAHGGTLTVASSPDGTRFTFRMPIA